MEYQKIILFDNSPNQPWVEINWVDINYDSRVTHNTNSQIQFKTSVLKSGLCDYNDVHIFFKGIISVAAVAAGNGNNIEEVIF